MTMIKHKPRAPGNYDPNEASLAASLSEFGQSLTQQHQAADTDINLIVKRYTQTGMLPQSALQPLYGDFSEAVDFHDAQNRIRAAHEAFMLIPAEIRARFENDPGKFIDFATNPENADELVKLKLRNPPARAVTPPEPASEPSAVAPDPSPQG